MEDAVLAEGIERLCKDLDVKPEDFKMLVLAWIFGMNAWVSSTSACDL